MSGGFRTFAVRTGTFVFAMALSGCLQPTQEVPRLADVELAEDVPSAELVTQGPEPVFRDGVFSQLFGRSEPPQSAQQNAIDAAIDQALMPEEAEGAEQVIATEEIAEPQAPPRRGGLFAGLRRLAPAPDNSPDTEAEEGGATLQRASLPADANSELDGQSRVSNSRRAKRSSEPDVAPGAPLAFGTVGRVCGLRGRALGKKVESFPEKGRGAFSLYDSTPGQTTARAFYITGFSDGCARQVTAANAIFGAPSMHERLRYGLPAGTLPASRTDEDYKTLKSRICRVPRSKPCGGAIDRLERNTVFVTLYSSFTGNQKWSNLLLHDGEVYSADTKQAE